MNRPPNVLVLHPEPLRWNIATGLTRDHHVELVVDEEWDPDAPTPDVVILVAVADITSVERCERLASNPGSAVIVASLDASPNAQLAFLRAGADDVVAASVPPAVLAARIAVQLRHRRLVLDRPGALVDFGALRLDTTTSTAEVAGRPLDLPPALFRTLHALVANAGQAVSTEALYRAAGHADLPDRHGNAVRIAISRLRTALGNRPGIPTIETVRLVGYRIPVPPDRSPPLRGVVAARR